MPNKQVEFDFGWNSKEWREPPPWDSSRARSGVSTGAGPGNDPDRDSDRNEKELDNRIELTCNFVLKQIRIMTREVRKVNKTVCPSAQEILNQAGGDNKLLHGSDVPKKTDRFNITIVAYREAPPGFEGLGILDIKPIFEKEAFALNKTNFKAVMNKLGDNTDKWSGKKLGLVVIQTRNPKTGTVGPGLAVAT